MDINGVVAIAQRVHDAERMNFSGSSTREERNANFARIVGIVHHGHPVYCPTPDPQWHLKNGGNGRPQSDDVTVSMPSRTFWDCIPDAGTDRYRFEAQGHGEFLPAEQNVYAPPVPAGGGGVVTPPPGMPWWTPAHQAVLQRLGGRDTRTIAQQLAYDFPAEQWGQKAAGAGRPVSVDVIGQMRAGTLYGVRVVPGTVSPETMTLAGQVFVPVVPKNHLGEAPVPTPTPVPTPLPPAPPTLPQGDLDALEARLVAKLDALAASVDTLRAEVIATVKGQSYEINANAGVIGKVRGTITPKP